MENTILIFLYLFIGHLVWDFLLQTSRLVAFKHKSVYWIILHCLIIWFAQTLLLLPYISTEKVLITITGIALLHFWVDFSKIKLNLKSKYPIIPFALDQLAHFIILLGAYSIIKNSEPTLFLQSWWFESLYENVNLLGYFSGVIFFSYTLDIIYLTLKLQKDPSYQYHRGYFDMLVRVSIFVVMYIGYRVYFS